MLTTCLLSSDSQHHRRNSRRHRTANFASSSIKRQTNIGQRCRCQKNVTSTIEMRVAGQCEVNNITNVVLQDISLRIRASIQRIFIKIENHLLIIGFAVPLPIRYKLSRPCVGTRSCVGIKGVPWIGRFRDSASQTYPSCMREFWRRRAASVPIRPGKTPIRSTPTQPATPRYFYTRPSVIHARFTVELSTGSGASVIIIIQIGYRLIRLEIDVASSRLGVNWSRPEEKDVSEYNQGVQPRFVPDSRSARGATVLSQALPRSTLRHISFQHHGQENAPRVTQPDFSTSVCQSAGRSG